MGIRHAVTALFALLVLAVPASASAAPSSGAVVFSRITQHTETKKVEGETPKPAKRRKPKRKPSSRAASSRSRTAASTS